MQTFADPEEFLTYAKGTGRQYASLTLRQGVTLLGSIIIELFDDLCPDTCANFISLIEGPGSYKYKGSTIHRVVKGGYIQGGDVADGTGKGDPGFLIPDESFQVKHDCAGIIGMASLGQPHTASSQFYITLNKLEWLDGKRVAFGRVLTQEAMDVVVSMQALMLSNERPVPEVTVSDAIMVRTEGDVLAVFTFLPVL